jgi:hypothetical protein
MKWMVSIAVAALTTVALGEPAAAEERHGKCRLANGIEHIVYLQFDNVHLRRDIPNVPSDLEQMPNLLQFLENDGTLFTNHHTPLISHTAVDILTSLTGVYGDKFGVPIGNSLRYFNPDGTTNGMSSFAYWTDPVATFSGQTPTDFTPQMIDQRGKIHPAPWVPFTRFGCDVGAFSVANIEFETLPLDAITVFGANSPEVMEAQNDPTTAATDFLGIAVHCAQKSPLCASGKPDLLPDEPGGYNGFTALFGNKYVQPSISPKGPVTDLDGNVIADSNGHPGFPGFSPTASQTLGYLATMLEVGVPVVYGYIADAHDNRGPDLSGVPFTSPGKTFGPGEAGYVKQLQAYDKAFGQFFARLTKDGITKDNTLFVVTADENDHFIGGPPSPANCDGVTTPCTYAKKGEIAADLSPVIATEFGDTTPFTVHSDDAPTFYITGNPAQNATVTRNLEQAAGALLGFDLVDGPNGSANQVTQALADDAEQALLHMITKDPARTPTFILFANPDYFLSASGKVTPGCTPMFDAASCFSENPDFAWNHGDFQEDITKTWLGIVGPGVLSQGRFGSIFSDHTDIRPTMLRLAGLTDDYAHDGRVLFEALTNKAAGKSLRVSRDVLSDLAAAYKAINAPLGDLGFLTLTGISTKAVGGDDATYALFEAQINDITAKRNVLAGQMIKMLEDAAFNDRLINEAKAATLIKQAYELIDSVH